MRINCTLYVVFMVHFEAITFVSCSTSINNSMEGAAFVVGLIFQIQDCSPASCLSIGQRAVI